MSTVEQRLAEIERWGESSPDWSAEQVPWLLSLVRSMRAVVVAAEEADWFFGETNRNDCNCLTVRAKDNLRAALQAYRRESEGK